VDFDKIFFHEHTYEIFPHSEPKWPSYALAHMGNRASSDFAVFLPPHCCDVMSEHAVKRVCVVVHCQQPAALIEFSVALAVILGAQRYGQWCHSGPALSRCNRCDCIGPRASGGSAPWCLRRLFIFSRYSLRSEYCKNSLEISLLAHNYLV